VTLSHSGQETRKAVLVADDQPSVRRLVSITIASDQYEVVEATDGEEAWRLAQQHRPVVAVLDVRMPALSGLEVTRAIKADPELAGTHVILLTAHGRESDVRAGLEAGADLYLTKPFSPLQLLNAVEEALKQA
jgi:two-component system phosphate regulon response regulator PhoB